MRKKLLNSGSQKTQSSRGSLRVERQLNEGGGGGSGKKMSEARNSHQGPFSSRSIARMRHTLLGEGNTIPNGIHSPKSMCKL